MKNEFKKLPRSYWETLDKLKDNGWTPCINQLPDSTWHVGLMHSTAPMPVVYFQPNGAFHTDEHRYRIHGHGHALAIALNDAFMQVNNLLEPKEPTKHE